MHRFDTPTPPTINVEFHAGDVTIEALETAETTVELTGNRDDQVTHDLIADTVIEQRGGTVVVLVPKHSGGFFGRTPELDLRISTPHGAGLMVKTGSADVATRGSFAASRISTGSGDISVMHLTGASRLRTGSGDITLDSSEADLDVQTGSGDIHVGSVSANASLQAGSGDIDLQHVAGAVNVQTGSGDINVRDAEHDVSTQTGSGSIHLGEVHRGQVKAQGASSDITVGVASGTAAWLDVRTLTGRVNTDLESTDEPRADDDKVRLQLNSVSGDITVVRA